MKRSYVLVAIMLTMMIPGLLALDEVTPTVTISNDPVAIPGEEYEISVTVSGAYIENSTLEIDFETATGWGTTEQGYFDFSVSSHEIETLGSDETLTLTFTMVVSADAAEKQYTIPIVFYGKSGECDSGCVPFRTTHSATFKVMDPENAQEQEGMGDAAFEDEKYSLAKYYYEEAEALYAALENDAKVSEMEQAIASSETGMEAAQLYDSGKSKLNAGNKEGALTDFTESREKYLEIGNASKVSELDTLIENCQANGNGDQPENGNGGIGDNMLLIVGLGAVIVVVVIAIVIKYK